MEVFRANELTPADFIRNDDYKWRNQICGQKKLVDHCRLLRVHKFSKHKMRHNAPVSTYGNIENFIETDDLHACNEYETP